MLFSSHQLADVDQIADHIAIVDRGRVVVDGALDDVRAAYRRIQLVFDGAAPDVAFKSRGVVGARAMDACCPCSRARARRASSPRRAR